VAPYSCFYFINESGDSPVKEFIDSLDYKSQRKFFFKKGLLEEFGPKLSYPHTKYIGDHIFELRFEGQEGAIRVLYFFYYEKKAIFTNGFIKKTNRLPREQKEMAIKRKELFFARGGDLDGRSK